MAARTGVKKVTLDAGLEPLDLQPVVWGRWAEFSKLIHQVVLLDVLVHIGVEGKTTSFSSIP